MVLTLPQQTTLDLHHEALVIAGIVHVSRGDPAHGGHGHGGLLRFSGLCFPCLSVAPCRGWPGLGEGAGGSACRVSIGVEAWV